MPAGQLHEKPPIIRFFKTDKAAYGELKDHEKMTAFLRQRSSPDGQASPSP
ncbi:hypothetical protein GR212_12995 [Rhizobium lusitanum]|uniref:Uncharacterized protein n=1 Tax=Rhizobium lusitanum TaxID=293958 RepID=A0A6L9U7U4_9HYPH|nr:hypothetical protein [Rhizobium lusitanum]NEI70492.1 hypothetical protein [Rhizobium lusitanum]